ncbi:4Fe-4S binding protein [Trichlorobacter ammonificans]|uniref:4Fe-4S binding domain-containing protein n=1 Tax=Trichlorobacter ammonificans TaxID=2916410 RepID=A0ABM9D820_9BACT|nr:4Fe-4S binding protein [Trichlorobacter ammonificans]CAH2030540.1 4Fe-4S binding domain-containing protein [Trichlorobacter ammonificans]
MSDRYVQPLRTLLQICFVLFSLWVGFQFARYIGAVEAGAPPTVARPGGIEAFLPISGLFGTAAWLKGGGINPVHPAAVVIFVTIVVLALALRRAFCSWICPVGAISEWLWKLGFHRFRRNPALPRLLDVALRGIKYLLMAYFLFAAVTWSLDSLQGFLFSGYHAISDQKLLSLFLRPSGTTLAVLGVLLTLSVILRNPFCRYLCPYGALLGLAAWLSPTAVQRDRERCVSCGVCSQVCPARIDVMHARRVADPECLGCWRCISHCRVQSALSMRLFGRRVISGLLFALLVVGIFWGGSVIGKLNGRWQTMITPDDYRQLLGR